MRRFLLASGEASEKYSRDPLGSALIVLPPSVQLAGHTSPYLSWAERISLGRRCQRCEETNGELEGLDQTDGLFDGTTDGQVIDGYLPEH
jgi:hypothetical protein